MGFLDWLRGDDKKPATDPEAAAKAQFSGPNSVFNERAGGKQSPSADTYRAQAKPSYVPKPKAPPVTRSPERQAELDAARSGRLTLAPSTDRAPLTDAQKQRELNAVRSGNFNEVTVAAADRDPRSGWGTDRALPAMDRPSDGVLAMLNEQNWDLPALTKQVGMPDTSFSSLMDLKQHDYRVTNQEYDQIRDTYSSERAQASGYSAPEVLNVDENMPLMHMQPTQSAALTWEAYNDLNSDQQAAVDWNTLLIDAREKDLGPDVALATPEEQASYDSEVERLFGEGRGSNRYAPNTMKLLSELDVVQLGQDLDEYLSLDRAIDSEELGSFKFSDADIKQLSKLADAQEQKTQYAAARAAPNLQAIDSANIQAAQQKIKTALANPEAVTYDFNTLMMPSDTDAANIPLGFGDTGTDQMFRDSLIALGSADTAQWGIPADADPMSFILDNLAETGADAATQEKFLQYVSNQAQLFGQYGNEEQKTMAALVNKRAGLGG